MIKKFIESLNDIALKAMFIYIDKMLDDHDIRIEELEQQSKSYSDTKKIVDSQAKTRATIKKIAMTAFLTTVINIIVAYILFQIGLSKGGE